MEGFTTKNTKRTKGNTMKRIFFQRRGCRSRACYVLSSITVMNRFSHVDLAAPPFPPPPHAGGKGGDIDARHRRRALRPPCPPPREGRGGQGGRLHRARVKDHRARRRRALRPPLSPPAGGQGGQGGQGGAGGRAQIMDERRKDPGLQPALGLLIDGAPRRTAAERWASCARALPCDALSLPKRGRCSRPPCPPRRGGKGGARACAARGDR